MTIALSRRSLIGAASIGSVVGLAAPAAIARPQAPPLFGPAPGIAWLTYNENPYGPSPGALRAMADAAAAGCYYADDATEKLRQAIARRFALTPQHVVVGNGSTEVLGAAAVDWGRRGPIVLPELGFSEPVEVAVRQGARLVRVPLRADMGIDLDAMAAAAAASRASMVYLCNPNNPTGMLIDSDSLRRLSARLPAGTTLLVDEAYNELTDDPRKNSVVDMVAAGRNVIVTRTFSKIYGLAGLRVGYALAPPAQAERISGNMMTVDLATSALAAALASYDDEAFMRFSKARVVEGRQIILDATRRLGLEALPSQTNFVFVKVPDAHALKARLAERGIIIRGAYGQWKQWSRVSTGKIEDVRRYAAALPAALGT
jgi:histidinol-phosphate aminotransferase